jgi:hypothetical protein
MDIYEKAAGLIDLSKKKKNLQEELDSLEDSMTALEKELYWAFSSVKLEELNSGGYLLKPVLKTTATAKDEKTVRVLRARGFGSLVKPTVHPSTASAFIRKQLELSGGELPKWIKDNFEIANKETISMRRDS